MRYFGAGKRRAWLAMLALCLLLSACRAPSSKGVEVLIDGRPLEGTALTEANSACVYFAVDGIEVALLPFDEVHVVTIRDPEGGENVIRMTGKAVYMEQANCENQDCVHMGEVTLENLELRVMGGFIICLPHKVSVEVRVP